MLKKLGWVLFVLSFVLFGLLLVVPFLNLSAGQATSTALVLAVAGEIAFWAGGVLLGREVVRKYRQKLNPFRRGKSEADSTALPNVSKPEEES